MARVVLLTCSSRFLARLQRLKNTHKTSIVLLAIGIIALCISTSFPNQVTYLTPTSKAPLNSPFPYIYMPAPKPDSRLIFDGNRELTRMIKVLENIFEKQPSWKEKPPIIIKFLLYFTGGSVPPDVKDGFNELNSHLIFADAFYKLSQIHKSMKLLNQRQYPEKVREMTCDNCFPYNFKNIISPKGLCARNSKADVVILVTTVPVDVSERMVVRQTWGSEDLQKQYNFIVVFLFGEGWPSNQLEILQREHAQYNDILLEDFKDNYYNLTQKVLMGYKWVLRECPKTKFVVRGADDTWVNIPELFSLIRTHGHTEAFQKHQVGKCFPAFIPYRGPNFKGFLSTFEYDQDIFPPYALGTVFVTSINLTRELVNISPNVPWMPIEDAYFGLALAQLGRGCHNIKGMIGYYTTHTEKI